MRFLKRKPKQYQRKNIIIKIDDVEYKVPLGWFDISIGQFQNIASIDKNLDPVMYQQLVLSELLQCDVTLINKIPIDIANSLTSAFDWAMVQPDTMTALTAFKLNSIEYRLIPEFNKMLIGEWTDLDFYLKSEESFINNIHKIIGILYRPLVKTKRKWYGKVDKDSYRIEDYDSTKSLLISEAIQENVSIDKVYGSIVFFCLFVNKSLQITKDCLGMDMKYQRKMMKKLSNKNLKQQIVGAGTELLKDLHKGTLQSLTK